MNVLSVAFLFVMLNFMILCVVMLMLNATMLSVVVAPFLSN
jgi:hypothetical protein